MAYARGWTATLGVGAATFEGAWGATVTTGAERGVEAGVGEVAVLLGVGTLVGPCEGAAADSGAGAGTGVGVGARGVAGIDDVEGARGKVSIARWGLLGTNDDAAGRRRVRGFEEVWSTTGFKGEAPLCEAAGAAAAALAPGTLNLIFPDDLAYRGSEYGGGRSDIS